MNKYNLTMLGTGNAMVSKCYNTCFTIDNGDKYFLVDAGGGNKIFNQLEDAGISYKAIGEMFVTHCHTDHILGAIWVIRQIATYMLAGKYEGNFNIYGHDKVCEALRSISNYTLDKRFLKLLDDRIFINEVKMGDVIETVGMKVTFFDIRSDKAKQFGFQAEFQNGKKLTCLGDEPYNEACCEYVKDSSWMLCEAFCLYRDKDIFKPYEKHHSTVLNAGRLAEELGIENIVLYHTEEKNLDNRKTLYIEEAQEVYKGKVFVPDDLDVIELY